MYLAFISWENLGQFLVYAPLLQVPFWQAHGSSPLEIKHLKKPFPSPTETTTCNAVNIWVNKEYGTVELIATTIVSDSSLCSVNYTFPVEMA